MRQVSTSGEAALVAVACFLASTFSSLGQKQADYFDSVKSIPLGIDRWYLDLGGEIRERYEYYSEPFFGLRGVHEDSYLLHRLLLSGDVHAGDYVRVFLQLGNHLETGKRESRTPTDVNELDIQQGFVDLSIPFDARSKLLLRAG